MFDHELVMQASQFAARAHAGQTRRDGETPYFSHPARVALLADMIFSDSDLVAVAFLHDVMEDCGVTMQELEPKFGMPVAAIVEMLTNVKQPGLLREQQKAADRIRLASMPKQIQQLKLLDRLDNIRELHADIRLPTANDRAWMLRYVRETRLLVEAIQGDDDLLIGEEILKLCDKIDSRFSEAIAAAKVQ